MKKRWNRDEDEICSRKVINQYVLKKLDMPPVEEFLNILIKSPELAGRDKNSVRMKIQNIKALLNEYCVDNSLEISPLDNVSKQNREVFLNELERVGILFS